MHPQHASTAPHILVTGGAGYIGSHTVLRLADELRLTVLDNLSRGHRALVPAGVGFHRIDLRDREAVFALFNSHVISAVVHFAGLAYVEESMAAPGLYFENNVTGTQNLLDAMVATGVARLVFSSSCTVYGTPASLPITEAQPFCPLSPYGESKAAVERMLSWYDRAHGLRSICLRYFNAAGADPGGRSGELHQPEPHLVPRLLETAATGVPFRIFGTDYPTPDGTCIRDYIHVTDLAEAHAAALRVLLDGGESCALNLGTGRGVSVREMVAAASRVTGKSVTALTAPRRPGDPAALVADATRAQCVLGWRPTYSGLTSILQTAWDWRQRTSPSRAASAAAS